MFHSEKPIVMGDFPFFYFEQVPSASKHGNVLTIRSFGSKLKATYLWVHTSSTEFGIESKKPASQARIAHL